jgi:polyhydroxyalkanoate synthesis regulator protein
MTQAFGAGPFGALEDQVRRNMEMFERAFAMFAPFARREAQSPEADKSAGSGGEIDDLKRQLDDVQKRLDKLTETKS